MGLNYNNKMIFISINYLFLNAHDIFYKLSPLILQYGNIQTNIFFLNKLKTLMNNNIIS